VAITAKFDLRFDLDWIWLDLIWRFN